MQHLPCQGITLEHAQWVPIRPSWPVLPPHRSLLSLRHLPLPTQPLEPQLLLPPSHTPPPQHDLLMWKQEVMRLLKQYALNTNASRVLVQLVSERDNPAGVAPPWRCGGREVRPPCAVHPYRTPIITEVRLGRDCVGDHPPCHK